ERFALVVMVPQARGVARQTGDHLFWRRDAQGLSPMTVQQIEDVHARAVRPRLELRAPTSPGRVLPDDQVEIDFGLQVYNPSSSVASFAVVTLGFGRLVSAQFLSGPEWRW